MFVGFGGVNMTKYLVEYVVEHFDAQDERLSMDVYAENGFEALHKVINIMTSKVIFKKIRGFYVTDVFEF